MFSLYSHTPVAGAGRGRGIFSLRGGEVKQLAFTDALGANNTMTTHPVGSTYVIPTPQPHVSDGEGDLTAQAGMSTGGPTSSTPISPPSGNDPSAELRDLITELGNRIGDSIASRLLTTTQPLSPSCDPAPPVATDRNEQSSNISGTLDLTKVNVVVKPDVREPAVFRGEGTDKCTVQEWIELMEVYLRKKKCPTSDQVEEILSHLMGRAKKIVKVGLKSSPNSAAQPDMIYDILRRYFSESPVSCLPLADFYATQPSAGENPVDYWVRLNTAAEQADRHLRKEGRKLENMSAEISMMFIRNCSDPELSSGFKSKPMSKWTSTEVQEAIDEYQREFLSKRKSGEVKPLKVTAAVAHSMPDVKEVVTAREPSSPSPSRPSESSSAEGGAFERVLCMLERVLEKTNQAAPPGVTQPGVTQPGQWVRVSPCRVCGDSGHSTRSHCMREKRCLACFEIGHQKKDCTKRRAAMPNTTAPAQGNLATRM